MIQVLIETDASGVTVTSQEALTVARDLASRTGDGEIEAVGVGSFEADHDTVVKNLGDHAVARLRHAIGDDLDAYGASAWATAVSEVVSDDAVVLASGTPRGNEVLAHLSARRGVAMAANVMTIEETEPLVVARQVLGGSALEHMRLPDALSVFSVAGHAVEPALASVTSTPEVQTFEPALSERDLVGRVRRTEVDEGDDTSALTGARVVVGAGRGAGSAEGFEELLHLTDLLGGALGVSRVVTSLGWRPHHEQVGQTGSRIAPEVYIACGISGAIQHWAGCQSAKTIIAINTDEDAPMVTRADYAVVGDLHEIVPAINAEIKARLSR